MKTILLALALLLISAPVFADEIGFEVHIIVSGTVNMPDGKDTKEDFQSWFESLTIREALEMGYQIYTITNISKPEPKPVRYINRYRQRVQPAPKKDNCE